MAWGPESFFQRGTRVVYEVSIHRNHWCITFLSKSQTPNTPTTVHPETRNGASHKVCVLMDAPGVREAFTIKAPIFEIM